MRPAGAMHSMRVIGMRYTVRARPARKVSGRQRRGDLEIQFGNNRLNGPLRGRSGAHTNDLIRVLDGDMVKRLTIQFSLVKTGDPVVAVLLFNGLLQTG